jgi:hypothetical protein
MTLTLIVGACLFLSGFSLALSIGIVSPEERTMERAAAAVFAFCGLGLLIVITLARGA